MRLGLRRYRRQSIRNKSVLDKVVTSVAVRKNFADGKNHVRIGFTVFVVSDAVRSGCLDGLTRLIDGSHKDTSPSGGADGNAIVSFVFGRCQTLAGSCREYQKPAIHRGTSRHVEISDLLVASYSHAKD